ncbi:helix-turn-helix domain-containing protein [Nocardia asteroides]|uniref:PucR family transcriptional regulator n=1 Tax=Nocardia asteroides TaxID=1824 RepID=UPI00342C6E10
MSMPDSPHLLDLHTTGETRQEPIADLIRQIVERQPVDLDELTERIVSALLSRLDRATLPTAAAALFDTVRQLWTEPTPTACPPASPQPLLDVLEHLNLRLIHAFTGTPSASTRWARRALAAALLHGRHDGEPAVHAAIEPADRYDLLSIQLPTDADTPTPDRRLHIVHTVLDTTLGPNWLDTMVGTSGFVLIPSSATSTRPTRYEHLTEVLVRELGTPITLIELHDVETDELPAAAHTARELAGLAAGLSRPPGTYTIDDLLLEYQLTRPGPARDRLATRVLPLLEHPHLYEALLAHVRYGWDRQRAAAAVNIHPNSLSYRLRRVADLTGFNPHDPHHSRILAAAVTLHHLESSCRAPSTVAADRPRGLAARARQHADSQPVE